MKARKIVEEVMKMNPEIESTHARYEQLTSREEMRDLYEARFKYNRDVASLVDETLFAENIEQVLIILK